MKKYGIVGTGFCGSTPLMFVLGGSKKVFALGESTLINHQTTCTVCERREDFDCPIWTKRFVSGLKQENKDRLITKRVKDMTKADTIIYADKNPIVYANYIENYNVEFDGFIVMFKSPEAFVYSMMTHFPNKYSIAEILEEYVRTYTNALQFEDTSFFVLYDDFVNKEEAIKNICKFIGIRFRQSLLNFDLSTDTIHSISGNTAAYMHIWSGSYVRDILDSAYWKNNWTPYHTKKILKNQGALYQDLRWRNLAADTKKQIKEDKESRAIYDSMMEKRNYI